MIITKIITFIFGIIESLFSILPSLPNFPETLINSLNTFFDLIFDNLGLLGFFVRISTLKILLPLVILVINFEYIYKGIMLIYHKIRG